MEIIISIVVAIIVGVGIDRLAEPYLPRRLRRDMNPNPCSQCGHDCRAAFELSRQLADTTKKMLGDHDERIAALETDRTRRSKEDGNELR